MVFNNISIGKRLKAIRIKRGLTQQFLSELIQVSPTFISCLENGTRSMSLETLINIVNVLNVSADDLLIDHLENTILASNHIFADLLSDCSKYELNVLIDIVVAAKQALRTNADCIHR